MYYGCLAGKKSAAFSSVSIKIGPVYVEFADHITSLFAFRVCSGFSCSFDFCLLFILAAISKVNYSLCTFLLMCCGNCWRLGFGFPSPVLCPLFFILS